MNERLIHLQIKIKSLAAEALIIRAKAKSLMRLPRPAENSKIKHRLDLHRTTVVRPHARVNHLAYGLLRGVPYEVMESKCNEPPSFDRVASIARRFGGEPERVEYWIGEAKNYLKQRSAQEAA